MSFLGFEDAAVDVKKLLKKRKGDLPKGLQKRKKSEKSEKLEKPEVVDVKADVVPEPVPEMVEEEQVDDESDPQWIQKQAHVRDMMPRLRNVSTEERGQFIDAIGDREHWNFVREHATRLAFARHVWFTLGSRYQIDKKMYTKDEDMDFPPDMVATPTSRDYQSQKEYFLKMAPLCKSMSTKQAEEFIDAIGLTTLYEITREKAIRDAVWQVVYFGGCNKFKCKF